MNSHLPEVFLSYCQVSVGVGGGEEVAVPTLRCFIASNADREDLCCVKVDFCKAFDECQRKAF